MNDKIRLVVAGVQVEYPPNKTLHVRSMGVEVHVNCLPDNRCTTLLEDGSIFVNGSAQQDYYNGSAF